MAGPSAPLMETLASLGLMAVSAFLAATILPFPSEATFAGLLHRGHLDPLLLLSVATLFNTLGSAVNWWVGSVAASGGIARLPARLRPDEATMHRAEALFGRFGWLVLLGSWIPGIGDLGTIAAGLLRYPFWRFVLLVGLGKGARYGAIWAGWIAVTD
jgi:membrane protein YqaA with SNARE-associated domain